MTNIGIKELYNYMISYYFSSSSKPCCNWWN